MSWSGAMCWRSQLSAISTFRQFDTAGGSSYWTNLGQGQPERLLGGGIFESTTVAAYASGGASKPAVYGDFSQYAIVDRIGMSVMYEPMVKDPTTGVDTYAEIHKIAREIPETTAADAVPARRWWSA